MGGSLALQHSALQLSLRYACLAMLALLRLFCYACFATLALLCYTCFALLRLLRFAALASLCLLRYARFATLALLCSLFLLAPITGLLIHFAHSLVGQLKIMNMCLCC